MDLTIVLFIIGIISGVWVYAFCASAGHPIQFIIDFYGIIQEKIRYQYLVWRYPYCIEIIKVGDITKTGCDNWIKENKVEGRFVYFWDAGPPKHNLIMVFRFKDNDNAAAFKLRFM